MEGKASTFKEDKARTCPICLHVWNDPTVLDNCKHIFCFECIIEWTRLKPECPLCKTALQLLKHHIWCDENELPTWESKGGQIENIMELRSEYELNQIHKVSRPLETEKHAIIQVTKHMLGELHSLRSLSVTTYASESIYQKAITAIENEMVECKQLLYKINQGVTRAELFNEASFRRIIYKKNLMPNSICTPLFNVTFNTEYIKNHREAVRAHLLPYLVREVTAITKQDTIDVDTYLDMMLEYFTAKIKRQAVITFLRKRGIENPHQFINNLFHFASAGQTIKVYDENSEYTPRRSNYVADFFPEDDDVLVLNSNSDVEVIGERNTGHSGRRQQGQHSFSNLPAINNNLLFMDQYQQQMGSSSTTMSQQNVQLPSHPTTSRSEFPAPPPNSISNSLRQLLDNFNQHHMNRPLPSSYFYRPPMPAHELQQQASGTNQMDNNSSSGSSNNRRRRQHGAEEQENNVNESSSVILDDSDDAVEIVGEVKKRRENAPVVDGQIDELKLMDTDDDSS